MTDPEFVVERANRLGLSHVAVPAHDLYSALVGDPVITSTLDGMEVCLRLMTPEEFMTANREAIQSLPDHCRPEPCTYEQAVRVTRPVEGTAAFRGRRIPASYVVNAETAEKITRLRDWLNTRVPAVTTFIVRRTDAKAGTAPVADGVTFAPFAAGPSIILPRQGQTLWPQGMQAFATWAALDEVVTAAGCTRESIPYSVLAEMLRAVLDYAYDVDAETAPQLWNWGLVDAVDTVLSEYEELSEEQ